MTRERFQNESFKLIATQPWLGGYVFSARSTSEWLEKFKFVADDEVDDIGFAFMIGHEMNHDTIGRREELRLEKS